MFQAAFQNVPPWWGECSSATPGSLGFSVDFARPVCNFNTRGAFVDARLDKEPEMENGNMGDDFLIADLSEFSNEDIAAPIGSTLTHVSNVESKNSTMTSCETISSIASLQGNSSETIGLLETIKQECGDTYPPPCSDVTELEWLSSLSDDTLIYGASNFGVDSFLLNNDEDGFVYGSITHDCDEKCKKLGSTKCADASCGAHAGWGEESGSLLPTPVPGRARSKRSRSGVRAWSSGILWSSSPTNSLDSTSDLPYVTTSHAFCPSEFQNISTDGGAEDESDIHDAFPTKERVENSFSSISTTKKSSKSYKSKKGQNNDQPRRCAHCLSQKTPQWRAGPTGPKTLCNACGVRFKSGRLFPEYRPAKSPTFLSYQHSNSHKKVIEMRRRRDLESLQKQGNELKVRFKLSGVDQSNSTSGATSDDHARAATSDIMD